MHITTQKIILVLSILVSIETAIAGGTLSLTNAVSAAWIPFVVAWCGILAFIGSTVVAVLAGNSVVRGPAPPAPPVIGAAPALKAVAFLAILVLGTLLVPTPGHAQLRKPAITGHLAKDIQTDLDGGSNKTTTAAGAGDILQQLRAKFTADLTADLNSALTLAQQVPAGCTASPPTQTAGCGAADTTAIPCYQALISLNGVINSYTPPPEKPHVISDLEQLRIVARTVQSTNFKDACAPLVQDIQSQANQLIASVLSIVGGAAKIGIAIP